MTVMTLNTRQFDYNKNLNTFTAEASSLEFRPGEFPMSFNLTSANTGRVLTLVMEEEIFSDGGEWFGRIFRVVNYQRDIADFTVEIFND